MHIDGTRAKKLAREIQNVRLDPNNGLTTLYDTRPPTSLEAILKRLPLMETPLLLPQIHLVKAPGWQSALRWVGGKVFGLWVDGDLDARWRTYAAVAAIGHALMHTSATGHGDKSWAYPLTAHDLEAREAAIFANTLLAPLYWVEPIAGARKRTTDELCEVFQVPREALVYQLNILLGRPDEW